MRVSYLFALKPVAYDVYTDTIVLRVEYAILVDGNPVFKRVVAPGVNESVLLTPYGPLLLSETSEPRLLERLVFNPPRDSLILEYTDTGLRVVSKPTPKGGLRVYMPLDINAVREAVDTGRLTRFALCTGSICKATGIGDCITLAYTETDALCTTETGVKRLEKHELEALKARLVELGSI